MSVPPRYQHTGFLQVRASTDPGGLDLPADLDLSDSVAVEQEGRAWLAKTWARPEVQEALLLASTDLCARVEQILDDGAGQRSGTEVRRALTAVASYLLRWQRRATPFGMFAGIGTAAVGPAIAEVGRAHRVVARADAEWVTVLVDQLERNPELRGRLTVVADSARIVRDGRVIVHRRAEAGAASPGPLRESSVRLTRPVRFALAEAGNPIQLDALVVRTATRFPTASPDKIRALVHGLVDGGLLITNLRPPMTAVDALTHLADALRAAGPEGLADVSDLLRELDRLRALLATHNRTPDPQQAAQTRRTIAARMASLAPGAGQMLAVDTRLDARIAVPERVLTEAALVASMLLRLARQPFGSTAWLDYHARFRARYGPGALVPVRELVAESGLGYPGGYLGAPRARPAWRMLTDRDTALLTLIQQAAVDGAEEIALTDADVEELAVGEHQDIVPPQRVELGVEVWAVSTRAIDRGDFRLRVTAAPRTCTSMAGRFAHLLDPADRDRLAATYAAGTEAGERDQPLAAQLSFPPRRPHNENVVRVEPLLPDVVSLSEHPAPGRPEVRLIGLDDLAVTADGAQMYLVQRSTGRRVIPRIPHALDSSVQSPPLARFLAEVADARSAVFGGFDLGAARVLPYVPRIRYGRTVLAVARWILTSTDLTRGQSGDERQEALRAWQQRWRVPARVVLCHGELRLPLDLDRHLDRALLLTHLERAGRIEVQEDGPPDAQGWIGRPAELLIPLTAISPSARPLPMTAAPGAILRPGNSALLQVQLVGNPARFDDILTGHLPRLVASLEGLVGLWWVRRHRDMILPESDQYLAVFLRLHSPDHYGPVSAAVAAFAADLEARGLPNQLTLASSPQHPARYGDGDALAAAESVFAADTLCAIAQITAAQTSGISAQALAAASMADLAASFALDSPAGYQALVACLRQEHGALDRTLRDQALDLADPGDDHHALRELAGGEAVVKAWRARATALALYYQAFTRQRDPRTALRTLLHEHHVRAVGVDPTLEKETGRLARAAALRRLALAGAR
ncbi:lantibiotic dehydratase [Frankia sp. R82]|uniref:lantibiotic dehydratase n=1 Tax=Frankia sp. R82 TaxID=2950553 RepID=UPI0020447E4B|nr:lantibiotic dehydratase [Frankia sp. R82]MCM3882234.1 lantibiotic dehydratase family protein [Frankia sp. R82]